MGSYRIIFDRNSILILILFCFLLINCSEKFSDGEEVLVAKVGELSITARDFQLNYEFGFANLKIGANLSERKKAYLQWMINEKMLAAEGYRQGLERSDYVQNNEQNLTAELLIEALLEKEVKRKIQVSNEEIREAINKSKVQFKFRYWPVSSWDEALHQYHEMNEKGFSEVVERVINNHPEIRLRIEDFTTDYLTWLEVPEEVMTALESLPLGGISKPVQLQNTYMIFQLLDFRREAITENEYLSKTPTFHKILFQRKFQQAITHYIDRRLTPQKIVTKSASLRMIAEALEEWRAHYHIREISFENCVRLASQHHKALNRLRQNSEQILSTFQNGQLTIAEFISGLSDVKFYEIVQDKQGIRSALNTQIALYIRNRFLVELAMADHLDKLPALQNEVRKWRDKWVYEQMMTSLLEAEREALQDTTVNLSAARLKQILDSMKDYYEIDIDSTVLDTISVSESQASRWSSMMILKGGTNRPVIPVVDPRWIKLN